MNSFVALQPALHLVMFVHAQIVHDQTKLALRIPFGQVLKKDKAFLMAMSVKTLPGYGAGVNGQSRDQGLGAVSNILVTYLFHLARSYRLIGVRTPPGLDGCLLVDA